MDMIRINEKSKIVIAGGNPNNVVEVTFDDKWWNEQILPSLLLEEKEKNNLLITK